jgi:hypothetical protein
MFIPDPNFFHSGSRILDPNFFHPGCASKNLSILTQKNDFTALRNMIRVFHPGSGSRIWILTFYLSQILILDPRSRIQGSKRHRIPDPDSQHCRFQVCSGCRGWRWLLTFKGRCCLATHSMDQLSEAFMCKKEFSVYFI